MNDDSAQPAPILLTRRALLTGLTGALGLVGFGSFLSGCGTSSGTPTSASPAASATSITRSSSPTPVPIGTILFTYTGHTSFTLAIDWSPDGSRIVSGGYDNTAQVWDAMTGRHVLVYRGHSSPVNFVYWSPDGKYIASGDYGTIRVWDAATGATILALGDASGNDQNTLNWPTWSFDSRHIAGTNLSNIQIWDITTGKVISSITSQNSTLAAPVWSPDGTYLSYYLQYAPPIPDKLGIWDIASHRAAGTITIPEKNTLLTLIDSRHSRTVWASNSKQLVYVNRDGLVETWDIPSGKQGTVYSHPGSGDWTSVGWSPDGKFIAAGSFDNLVQIWDAITARSIFTLNTPSDVISLAWSPDSKYIASTQGQVVIVWKASD
jgi:eukaryotic-like serine/threonine-protein kinase